MDYATKEKQEKVDGIIEEMGTEEQFWADIDKAIEEVEQGKVVPMEQVLAEMRKIIYGE